MIILIIAVVAIGCLAGAGADALLRGSDPSSLAIVLAGLVGAVVGFPIRTAFQPNSGGLVQLLTALLRAMLAAFGVRVRISAVR